MRFSIAPLLLLAGCASSGIIQTNPNEFMVAKQSAGGLFVSGEEVKADLYKEANSFCAGKGQTVETISADSKNAAPFVRTSQASLKFRCVSQ